MIFRIEKTKDYTVMSNYHLREKKMSLKAKGLLSWMLSNNDDWDYSIAGIVANCKENETAVQSALQELKDFGDLEIRKLMPESEMNADGTKETIRNRIEYEYVIHEKPISQNSDCQGGDFLRLENQGIENQGIENPVQRNTNKINTKIRNTKIKKTQDLAKDEELTPSMQKHLDKLEDVLANVEISDVLYKVIHNFILMHLKNKYKIPVESFELQLGKLTTMEEREAINSVHNSINYGWKSMVYDKTSNNTHSYMLNTPQEKQTKFEGGVTF
jgi:hypothetical protein